MDRFEQEVLDRNLTQPFSSPWWQGRAFQLCGRSKALRQKRVILSMDKGLGKTTTVESIFEERGANTPGFTVVIVTTARGMAAWTRDIEKFPEHADKMQLIRGTRVVRENLWKNSKARYFVCIHNTLLDDAGVAGKSPKPSILPKWFPSGIDAWVLDEFHRYIRSRKSKIFQFIKDSSKDTEYLILDSGSAVSKGPEDLWAALHLLDRKMWSTYWGYVNTWSEVNDGNFGKQVKGPKINPNTGYRDEERASKWRQAVASYVFHVAAEDVPNECPPITNDPLYYDLPTWQKELHDDLLRDQIAEIPGASPDGSDREFLFSNNRLSNLFKIRTALICPSALSPEWGVGGGIEAIAEDIEEGELDRAAIFTPFKAPIPYLTKYLQERGFSTTVLQGGIGLDEQEARLSAWRQPVRPGDRKIVLSTIKYAESWEIPEARYGYLLGYEYDPEDNDQARKRLRRLISPAPVYIQWTIGRHTYDESVIQLLMDKKDGRDALMLPWNK